ncbi:tRNA methyl transferase PRC-barrel domain-containing protein, partial [Treponema endosymbiont of Eucomonympha sp.]|uniref:tRNA methyl transferase PRC-barrel domain-containing protein n=1 Tax=Treponema endosymbiont of Eucomonympha sp. TaxID=1580831 RepID=UPI0027D2E40F
MEHYTVGQRRGLGVSSNSPLYVHSIDAAQNRVVGNILRFAKSAAFSYIECFVRSVASGTAHCATSAFTCAVSAPM